MTHSAAVRACAPVSEENGGCGESWSPLKRIELVSEGGWGLCLVSGEGGAEVCLKEHPMQAGEGMGRGRPISHELWGLPSFPT